MKPVFLIDLVNPIIFVPMVLLPPLDPAMGDLVTMLPPPLPLDPAMGDLVPMVPPPPPLDPAMGDLVPMVPPPPPLDPAMGEIEFETLIQH